MISIQVWRNQRLIDDFDYDPEVNQMEMIEIFADYLNSLKDVEDGFTLIANRVS